MKKTHRTCKDMKVGAKIYGFHVTNRHLDNQYTPYIGIIKSIEVSSGNTPQYTYIVKLYRTKTTITLFQQLENDRLKNTAFAFYTDYDDFKKKLNSYILDKKYIISQENAELKNIKKKITKSKGELETLVKFKQKINHKHIKSESKLTSD